MPRRWLLVPKNMHHLGKAALHGRYLLTFKMQRYTIV